MMILEIFLIKKKNVSNNEINNNNKRFNGQNQNLFRKVNNNQKQIMNRNLEGINNIRALKVGKTEEEQFNMNLQNKKFNGPVKIQDNKKLDKMNNQIAFNNIPNKKEIYNNISKNVHSDNFLNKNKDNSSKENHRISQVYKKEKESNLMLITLEINKKKKIIQGKCFII